VAYAAKGLVSVWFVNVPQNVPVADLDDIGYSDQVPLRVDELTDDEVAARGLLRSPVPGRTESFCFVEGRFDVGDAHIEESVGLVVGASTDTAGDADATPCARSLYEAVVAGFGDDWDDGSAGVELPTEHASVEVPQPDGVPPDDFEVHDRASHLQSFLSEGTFVDLPRTTLLKGVVKNN
jgi:hypothetical protein